MWLSLQNHMLKFALMLPVKLPFVDRIHPQSNVAMDVENKTTGDSILNEHHAYSVTTPTEDT